MTRINIYTLPQEATPIKKSINGQFFYEMEYIQNMNISLNLKKTEQYQRCKTQYQCSAVFTIDNEQKSAGT
ncbi:hypothetical protein ABR32_16365 [Enterobacter cloacae subsp. dissolvens]|nr:hypothetical protein ABR32_16365 [Enterobacter cloacae subsp. dissolvens]